MSSLLTSLLLSTACKTLIQRKSTEFTTAFKYRYIYMCIFFIRFRWPIQTFLKLLVKTTWAFIIWSTMLYSFCQLKYLRPWGNSFQVCVSLSDGYRLHYHQQLHNARSGCRYYMRDRQFFSRNYVFSKGNFLLFPYNFQI